VDYGVLEAGGRKDAGRMQGEGRRRKEKRGRRTQEVGREELNQK
jgi:hypothetical protein